MRILLDDGSQLAQTPTTIQSELGQRGEFQVEIPFSISGERQAFIQVYSSSPRDSGITHLASTGVLLADTGAADIRLIEDHPEQIQITNLAPGDSLSGGMAHVEGFALASFEQIRPEEQLKITYLLGNRYEALRRWLANYAEGPALPLDHFLSRLFEELLSQPGYVFHEDRDSAAVTAHLVDSASRFRRTVGDEEPFTSGAFVTMVEQGVVAAQYLPPSPEEPDAVLLAPAYTFVMSDRPVDVQFWLDLGSSAWSRRLYQPLTHPYVLTRGWPEGAPWTDADEDLANRQTLHRLVLGLVRRCRRLIYLADSTYNERGFEDHGLLQQAIHRTLRRAALVQGSRDV